MIPNLFIPGAMKSGTTSLHRMLETHADIFFPPHEQEIHFFDVEENYARGIEWFEAKFSAWNGEPVVGQTSPLYMYLPVVPERIHAVAPQAKFIIILRNPVDRAYSHYWHAISAGREIRSFEQALAHEKEIIHRVSITNIHSPYDPYVDQGRYTRQITRLLEYFPREQLLIVLQEDFKRDMPGVAARCATFLGLDPGCYTVDLEHFKVYNTAMLPRLLPLQVLRYHLRRGFATSAAKRLASMIDRVNLREARYPPMRQATRRHLEQELYDEMMALQALTGINLAHWFTQEYA